MQIDDVRALVLEVIGAVAPGRGAPVRADRPLGEELALDSMDWLNLSDALQQRLGVEVQELSPSWTLDALVEALARSRPAGRSDHGGPTSGSLRELPHAQYLLKGRWVTMRALQPDDSDLEARFVRELSGESRYKRFMVTMKELPPGKLHDLTEVDQDRHVALAALAEVDGRATLVGVARYVVDGSGTGCEFAVTVADQWRGSGLAGILMRALIEVARSRGLQAMEGLVLRRNEPMLKLARQLGFESRRDPDDPGTVRVRRALPGLLPA